MTELPSSYCKQTIGGPVTACDEIQEMLRQAAQVDPAWSFLTYEVLDENEEGLCPVFRSATSPLRVAVYPRLQEGPGGDLGLPRIEDYRPFFRNHRYWVLELRTVDTPAELPFLAMSLPFKRLARRVQELWV